MPTIFTKIINREIPGYIVAEDDRFIAFLDIMPLVEGHLLVVPKKETDYIFDLEEDLYIGLQLFARKVALAQKKAIHCERIGLAVVGLEVPHVHIHLVPLNTMDDINFSRPKLKLSEQEFIAIATRIKAEIE